MTPISRSLADAFASIKAITETPEYQANSAKIAAENIEYERQQAQHRRTARLRVTGVPPETAIGEYRTTIAITAALDFIDGPPALRFLMLGGKKGTGKTFALGVTVWNRGGKYVDAQALVAAGSFDGEFWHELERAPILALDELGAEYPNPAFEANLYALLDRRYRMGKRTLIATNLNTVEFKNRYCEHGLDRLLERLRTGGRWVALDGESLRQHWTDTQQDQETTP